MVLNITLSLYLKQTAMTDTEKLDAIQALIDGRFDDEQLMKIGDLWSGPDQLRLNIESILDYGLPVDEI